MLYACVGLNRGDLGPRYVVKFERVGPKILMVQPNYAYRATTQSASERKAVDEAFAQSIIHGFTVGAETGGRVLVDATDFFLRDASRRGNGQGATAPSDAQGFVQRSREAVRPGVASRHPSGFPGHQRPHPCIPSGLADAHARRAHPQRVRTLLLARSHAAPYRTPGGIKVFVAPP